MQVYKVSDQFLAAIGMCLQNTLAAQMDFNDQLLELDVVVKGDELMVLNPPKFQVPEEMFDVLSDDDEACDEDED